MPRQEPAYSEFVGEMGGVDVLLWTPFCYYVYGLESRVLRFRDFILFTAYGKAVN